jgi:hypothetical protein
MESTSRPKRSTQPPAKFSPWEEGDSMMVSERKKKSRAKGVKVSRETILEKKKLYLRKYRENNHKSKKSGEDEESGEEEEVEEEDKQTENKDNKN